jgi:hypothetical protein
MDKCSEHEKVSKAKFDLITYWFFFNLYDEDKKQKKKEGLSGTF